MDVFKLTLILPLSLFTVALAGVYLDKRFHHHMIITGQATIHGRVEVVTKIKEKCIPVFEAFADQIVNMVIPYTNTIDNAIWSDLWYIKRDREDAHSTIRREWFNLDRKERKRLNVFAAKTLYDVLELAIIAPPGMSMGDTQS